MDRFLTGLSWDGESPEVLWNEWLDWKLFNWLPLLLRGWSFLESENEPCQNIIPFILALIRKQKKKKNTPCQAEINFPVAESYKKLRLQETKELNRKTFKSQDQGLGFAQPWVGLFPNAVRKQQNSHLR